MNVIIDCEFTGLDNNYVDDNEICQVKLMNVETGKSICRNYATDKAFSAYNQIVHKVQKYDGEKFSSAAFDDLLAELEIAEAVFWGFSTESDAAMLKKYGVEIEIKDIQEMLRLSDFESQLATQGCSLECAFFIVTSQYPPMNTHADGKELELILALYRAVQQLDLKEHFEVMPYGFCAGMPIADYVEQYRRQADGYRYNNNDLLASSLTAAIPIRTWFDDDDEEDDHWDEDD